MKSTGFAKIGTASRSTMPYSSKDLPGPDRYSSQRVPKNLKQSPQAVFGSSVRQPLNVDPRTPGPGNYIIPSRAIEGRQQSL